MANFSDIITTNPTLEGEWKDLPSPTGSEYANQSVNVHLRPGHMVTW